VNATNQLPRDWRVFLGVDENKKELFKFLAQGGEKQVISTFVEEVICNPSRVDVSNLAPCNHEDTRMMLHAADAVKQGFSKIVIRTVGCGRFVCSDCSKVPAI